MDKCQIRRNMEEKFILCVGLVCIDEFHVCNQFPEEDTGVTCLRRYNERGGNASNNCTVLSCLGESCEYFGTMSGSVEQIMFLKNNFDRYRIKYEHCPYIENALCPVSTCILSRQTGSRTVLHYNRNLPELTCDQFQDIPLQRYKWIHFEGRPNTAESYKMLQLIHQHNQRLTSGENCIVTSIELEKRRSDFGQLVNMVDYVFISKEHARFCGYTNKEETVNGFFKQYKTRSTNFICAWAETGAVAKSHNGQTFHSDIFSPAKVVDTCGAGDTFIAATICALSKRQDLQTAIEFGCRAAGAKCGIQGFDELKKWFKEFTCSDSCDGEQNSVGVFKA